jgi:hypothetical protein
MRPRDAKPSKLSPRDGTYRPAPSASDDSEPDEKRPFPVKIIVAAVLVGVAVLALLYGTSGPSKHEDVQTKIDPPTPVTPKLPRETKSPIAPIDINADHMDVPLPKLPLLTEAAGESAKLYYGTFPETLKMPESPRVLLVSRTAAPSETSFRTLAEAMSRTVSNQFTIIEIHDQGPLYVPALPPLKQCRLLLRAGDGYRPLLACDATTTGTGATATEFLALSGGELILDNLDVVARAPEGKGDAPAVLFRVQQGDFLARNCTFSVTTDTKKPSRSLNLLRLEGSERAASLPHCRLRRCYVRGTDMIAVGLHDTSAEVLLEDSLLVTGRGPLLQAGGREDQNTALRVVRSTLVSSQNLLDWGLAGTGSAPRLQAFVLDSLLARNDPRTSTGDLLHLSGDVRRVQWKAFNSVYAGWQKLLSGVSKDIVGTDLESWRGQFAYGATDRALPETWPMGRPSRIDDLQAATFLPYDAPVTFAARTVPWALGCTIGTLPPVPRDWLRHTYLPQQVKPVAKEWSKGDVPIDRGDGKYHRIDLDKVDDLGKYLQKLLRDNTPVDRLVVHLVGVGPKKMSPVHIRGVGHLVIYVEHLQPAAPLVLVPEVFGAEREPALIDVEGASLEMIGVRLFCENKSFPQIPPYLIRMRGGDLLLSRSWLIGPLSNSPESFRALISFSGAGTEIERPFLVSMSHNLLLSGKGLLHVAEAGAHVHARNNLGIALGSAVVQIDAPAQLGPAGGIIGAFDHNTWALRQSFLTLRPGADEPTRRDTVVLQSWSDYYVAPFAQQPSQAVVLRYQEPVLTRGLLHWQGNGNAYDQRLQGFFAPLHATAPEKQSLKDWQTLWGPGCEQGAFAVGLTLPRGVPIDPDNPLPMLNQLMLPRESGQQGLAGASLERLQQEWRK